MATINLNLFTQTPIGNFSHFKSQPMAFISDYIFLIDEQKLYKILSLLKILQDFNNFYNTCENKNITIWLKQKGLLSLELLNEIKLYKIKFKKHDSFIIFHPFFASANCYKSIEIANKYICNFLKYSLQNILLYRYYEENNYQLNEYINNLISFLNSNPQHLENEPLDFLLKSIIEMDKRKLNKYFNILDYITFRILCTLNSTEEYLCTQKIEQNNLNLQECLKSGLNIHFKLNIPQNMVNKIDKYLILSEKITTTRIKLSNKEIPPANFCFLSKKQILYMNLFEENRQALNSKLKEYCKQQHNPELFYFDFKDSDTLAHFNYANIDIISH